MEKLYIGKYEIDPILFTKGFAVNHGPYQCETKCCASGVWTDVKEKEVIMSYKDQIKAFMDETQTTDDTVWFDPEEITDTDFVSGRAIGTQTHNNKCVFLKKDGRCSVQLFSKETFGDAWKIKPFYCVAFPICVSEGVLTFDDYQQGCAHCCSIVDNAEVSMVESCKAELEYVLGAEGYQTLVAMKQEYLNKAAQ
ncbi:MAG TPA: DUF3109 family protein [Bacteroidota bacterium]|nr:DUF3109 family protein [Bacteroidota bacterium]